MVTIYYFPDLKAKKANSSWQKKCALEMPKLINRSKLKRWTDERRDNSTRDEKSQLRDVRIGVKGVIEVRRSELRIVEVIQNSKVER